MNKIKVLLSAAAVVAVLAGVVAANARANFKIYTEDTPGSGTCHSLNVSVTAVKDASGVPATFVPGACPDRYLISTLNHD